jgi:hypothetical protein
VENVEEHTAAMSGASDVAEALGYGIVGLNTGLISTGLPVGRASEPGPRQEGSTFGTEEVLAIKSLCLGGIAEHVQLATAQLEGRRPLLLFSRRPTVR